MLFPFRGTTESIFKGGQTLARYTTIQRAKPTKSAITEIAGSTRSLQDYRNRGVNPLATILQESRGQPARYKITGIAASTRALQD